MIALHNQVAPLAQSITLKELGVEQDSLFYWGKVKFPLGHLKFGQEQIFYCSDMSNEYYHAEKIAAAFTVAELGVALDELANEVWCDGGLWYRREPEESETAVRIYHSEAAAKGHLLQDKIESGTLAIEEVNQRITK